MKIKPIITTLIAAGGVGLAVAGGCKYRKSCKEESADVFIRQINTGKVEEGKNELSYKFTKSLVDNKAKIQEIADISDEQYEIFRDLAVGIAKEETNFGLDNKYVIKKFLSGGGVDRKVTEDEGFSQGLTNLKVADLGDGEKSMLDDLGVTNVFDPEQSAIATMVHLRTLKNSYYNKYLKNIAPHQETPLTMEEYVLARWKNLRLDTTSKSKNVKSDADFNMKAIPADRSEDNPKYYVWKVLRSVGYIFDFESGKVIKKEK